MTRILPIMLLCLLAGMTHADEQPVVVELFTSQGCSSCPPADVILTELAKRDDVIALGLHVDYWDYLGWADALGRPELSARQRAYSQAHGRAMVYTPQMIVNGLTDVVGNNKALVLDAITDAAAQPDPVAISLQKTDDKIDLTLALEPGAAPVGRTDLFLVRWIPQTLAEIGRGENAGKRILYVNAVTQIEAVGAWNGDQPLRLNIDVPASGPGAILVQRQGLGRILAAQSWP